MIEKELDQAIVAVAQGSPDEGDGLGDIGSVLVQTISNAPTTAKRRI